MYVFLKKCVNIYMYEYIFLNYWIIFECSKGEKVVFVVSDLCDCRYFVFLWICCKV